MRGRPSVWARTARLATVAPRPDDLDAVVQLIAAESGTTLEQVRAEALEFGERCRAAGATTVEEVAAFLGAELGIPTAEVLAETRTLLASLR